MVAKLLAELLSGLPAALVEMIIPSSFYEGLTGPIRMDESIKMTRMKSGGRERTREGGSEREGERVRV